MSEPIRSDMLGALTVSLVANALLMFACQNETPPVPRAAAPGIVLEAPPSSASKDVPKSAVAMPQRKESDDRWDGRFATTLINAAICHQKCNGKVLPRWKAHCESDLCKRLADGVAEFENQDSHPNKRLDAEELRLLRCLAQNACPPPMTKDSAAKRVEAEFRQLEPRASKPFSGPINMGPFGPSQPDIGAEAVYQ